MTQHSILRHSGFKQTATPRARLARWFRPALVSLEGRITPSAFLFVEFGDNFPLAGQSHVLNTTIGALRDVADAPNPNDKILGTVISDSNGNSPVATPVSATRLNYSAAERSEMMAVIQRAYRPLEITVVELTQASVTLSDGRTVAGARNMGDVINTLRGGNAASKDAYIFATFFVVDPNGPTQRIYNGGGGNSPGSPTLGVSSDLATASNLHDDVALVYANFVGGDFRNTMNNIAHEAGHCFGLQHGITNSSTNAGVNLLHRSEIMSYRNTNNTSSSMFTRYPMIRGDGNSPPSGTNPVDYNSLVARPAARQSPFNQLNLDPNVGPNPNFTFVSGTGAHDVIRIARAGSVGLVSITAYSSATRTAGTEITVPGIGGFTFNYTIPLTRSILVYAGDSDDQIVVGADLGVNVEIDGMRGTDSLVINGAGAASAVYAPNTSTPLGADFDVIGNVPVNLASYGGTVTIGGSAIQFYDFEPASTVEIGNVQTVTVTTLNSGDIVAVDTAADGRFRVSDTSAGVLAVPLLTNAVNLIVDAGAHDSGPNPADVVTLDLGGLPGGGLPRQCTVLTGPGNDSVTIKSLADATTLTIQAGLGDDTIAVDSNGTQAAGTVDSIRGTISVIGQGGYDALTLEDSGDTTADTVTVNESQVGVPGDSFYGDGGSLVYSQLARVTLNLSFGPTGDIVNLTPALSTTFYINGNTPFSQSGIGDRLNLDLTGVTNPVRYSANSVDGRWAFGNRRTVFYADIEEQNHNEFDFVPPSNEFLVNTFTTDDQDVPAVATDGAGNFVVVWSSAQDGDGKGVYAQRFAPSGSPIGTEFQVNTFTTGDQVAGGVAMDADGNFVITWSSDGQDGSGQGVYGQRFTAAGAPVGDEFRINSTTDLDQQNPVVAMNSQGDFVVSWISFGQDGSDFGVFAQRYDAAGTAQGNEIPVNETTTGSQIEPSIGMDAAGNFFVAWASSNIDGGIDARRFDSASVPVGGEIHVSASNHESKPAVAMNTAGESVIAWQSKQSANDYDIFARRYQASGAAQGGQFQANGPSSANETDPSAAIGSNGSFVIAWTTDTTIADIRARWFTSTGEANGADFQVNTTTADAQANSAVAIMPTGGFAAVWQSQGNDGSGLGVFGRVFTTVLPPASVTSVQINDGSAQRSHVASLTVTFDASVTFAGAVGNAFTLTRNGGGAVTFTASAVVLDGVTVVTLSNFSGPDTESGSLRDGRYTLTALASQITAGAFPLNGGADVTFGDAESLFRFYGDMNGDRRVDISDFGFFSLAYLTPGNYNPTLDFNGDGRIDIADFGQFSVRYFTTLP